MFNEKPSLNLKYLDEERGKLENGKNSREKLFEEIIQHEKFPNDYRYFVFSRHVYLYNQNATNKKGATRALLNVRFKRKQTQSWLRF
jgi:hypothetical protein